jgi:hypothetical protein
MFVVNVKILYLRENTMKKLILLTAVTLMLAAPLAAHADDQTAPANGAAATGSAAPAANGTTTTTGAAATGAATGSQTAPATGAGQ